MVKETILEAWDNKFDPPRPHPRPDLQIVKMICTSRLCKYARSVD
jgi:hypothetical protein